MADPIISLDDVKNELEIPLTDTDYDARLTSLISDMIAEAETEMEAKLEAVTDSIVYLDGGRAQLFLPHLNVTAVEVTEDVDRAFTGDPVDAGDYTFDVARGVIRKDKGRFISGRQVIKAKYTGGYTNITLPRDLKRALIMQTAYRWRRRKDPGLSAVSFPDGTVNKFNNNEWLDPVKRVLERHGRIFL